MIAVDANVLVYSSRRDSTFHERALAVMRELSESPAPWGLPWACVHEFYAVVTSARFYEPPTAPGTALRQVAAWLDSPSVQLLTEGPTHFDVLSRLLRENPSVGSRIHDAKIAAICLQHGVSALLTADRDFSRFKGLRTRNPFLA